jgi:hypothetical protein
MTVSSRFLNERPPLAARQTSPPRFDVPPNRAPIPRLAFREHAKMDWSTADLAHAIGVAALRDAVLFLDTNVFTTALDPLVWEAIYTKRVFVTPGVWKEIQPWLKTPFRNKLARDCVYAAVQKQVDWHAVAQRAASLEEAEAELANIQVLFLDESFSNHGYDYYLRLLALRKAVGPSAVSFLTTRLGRGPTNDEFLAEVQRRFGMRGLHMAKKGLKDSNSPNVLNDEQLVLMAILTAIMRGTEVLIITRDTDVLEQYYKALVLMKEHYRAMCVGELYGANPQRCHFERWLSWKTACMFQNFLEVRCSSWRQRTSNSIRCRRRSIL